MVKPSEYKDGNPMNKFNPSAYLSGLNIDVMHFGLEAINGLLSRMGSPQNAFQSVLIAGTNGKGSTAAMLASILRQAGLKVGLYTSPHLIDIRERIVINGIKISRKDLGELIAEIKDYTLQPVTYFECLTAAAFLYFSRRKVDIAVLEVGLGGRLDATNICHPLVSVITNIALEHTAYLGKTLEAIACEKAGIIKKNGVCVTAVTQKKVIDVFSGICHKQQAELLRLGIDFKMKIHRDESISYEGQNHKINRLTVPLRGPHQLSNAALALATIEVLGKKGYRIGDSAIQKGLAQTRWEARLEILRSNPLFLLDGAHNPAGIVSLCRVLGKDLSGRRLILIFSALADKDYRRMLRKIAPLAHKTFLPPLATKRAVAPQVLAAFLQSIGYPALMSESVTASVRQALQCAGENDLICACGSLYLAGEVKQTFHQMCSCGKGRGALKSVKHKT
jgi:dihydrofolate synthase/folylpolyglutamate synthase